MEELRLKSEFALGKEQNILFVSSKETHVNVDDLSSMDK